MHLQAATEPVSIRTLNRTYIIVGVADATAVPFIAIYLYHRGFNAALIGVVLAATALASFLAAPAWAYMVDHGWRADRTIVLSSAAAAVLWLLMPLAPNLLVLAVVIVLAWIARAPVVSLLDAISLHSLQKASRTGYARIRLRTSAGWAVSALVTGALLQAFGVNLIPFLYAPLLVIFAAWVWLRVHVDSVTTPRSEAAPAGTMRVRGATFSLIGFLLSTLLFGTAMAAALNFVTLQINFLGGGLLLIGTAGAFQAFAEIPTMGFMHRLTGRVSHRTLYVAGCVIYCAVFAAWAFVSNPAAVALLRLVLGVGFALAYVAMVLIPDDLAPAHLRSTGQALVKGVTFGLAPVLGTLGGGLVYATLGARPLFVGSAGLTIAAAVVALLTVPVRRAAAPSPEAAPSPAAAQLATSAAGGETSRA